MDDPTALDGASSDIVMLLDRTTPRDLAPLDLPDLARRGRHRRNRRRSALGGAAVAVVAVLALAAVQPWRSDDGRPAVDVGVAGPNGQPLTDPAGSWTQLADPPFAPRSNAFGGPLSDGRVLVWGGQRQGEVVDNVQMPEAMLDGGIYDPETGEWTAIPEPPLSVDDDALLGASCACHLVDDRLVVVMALGAADASEAAAVYDVSEGRWFEVPSEGQPAGADVVAWDGETLVFVDLHPTTGEGVTSRWTVGESEWRTGTPPPLGWRYSAGTASDGERLAIWGGYTSPDRDPNAQDRDYLADGAIYDVAADTWELIPSGPLSARAIPSMLWDGDRLVVGGGNDNLANEDVLPDLAAYTPSTGTWTSLPSAPPPEGGAARVRISSGAALNTVAGTFVDGADQFLVTDISEPQSGTFPRWVLVGDRWELAPTYYPGRIGDFLVAVSGGSTISQDARFAVRVRTGPDEWIDGVEAPFRDLSDVTVVVTGTQLVVVGGHDLWDLSVEPGEAWAFDLAG